MSMTTAGRDFPFVHESRLERGEPFFRMHEVPGTPNARTRIDVIERGQRHWLYRLQPVTGRKHQLRVHMAALGAPIIGDPLYPALRDEAEDFSGQDRENRPRRLSRDWSAEPSSTSH